ncbi:hypothetical protein SAQ01S_07570 [Sphingomonas aquatilis NBRC 16722]|uniref:Uncharacterized protein n=1 Tax=Sphingomonas aquatilis TaxID=93063 RepID=A0AAW3TTX6_9SPHN|nr:hypothetical protein [Sphingomonas aquatilis]MBB3876141.1 hypothetical protein [Sphingomonas aquatilis]GEM70991.1 hypothetical protein SAQ01S_07570 [Sphingomonas aquatilis NBRC 16722]
MAEAPDWPRMMKRTTAARYCDLAPAKFTQEVAAGRLPLPVKLGGEDHWFRDAVDEDLRRIAGAATDWRKDQPGLAA